MAIASLKVTEVFNLQILMNVPFIRTGSSSAATITTIPGRDGIAFPAAVHLGFLDGMRGVAIIAVFLVHALGSSFGMHHLPWLGWVRDFRADPAFLALLPLSLGWAGVAIFFVVSGFCIHFSWERSRAKSFTQFYGRRFFRIYPPYLFALLLFSAYDTWRNFHGLGGLGQLGSHALLLHNLREGTFYGINPAFWSIAVEFQLYLIYPLLLLAVRAWGWSRTLWITGAIEIGLRALASGWDLTHTSEISRFVSGSPFFFWFSWATGAALADTYLKGNPLPFSRFPAWLFPVLFVAAFLFRPLDSFAFTFAALATANLLGRRLGKPASVPTHPAVLTKHLNRVGEVSYSLYLIHLPIIAALLGFVQRLFSAPINPLVNFAFCLLAWPIIVLLSSLVYRWVEQPSITLGKFLLARPIHLPAVRA